MAGSMVYRLRVAEPAAAHMASFIKAMTAIQDRLDNKSYNYISGLHGVFIDTFRTTGSQNCYLKHA